MPPSPRHELGPDHFSPSTPSLEQRKTHPSGRETPVPNPMSRMKQLLARFTLGAASLLNAGGDLAHSFDLKEPHHETALESIRDEQEEERTSRLKKERQIPRARGSAPPKNKES